MCMHTASPPTGEHPGTCGALPTLTPALLTASEAADLSVPARPRKSDVTCMCEMEGGGTKNFICRVDRTVV